VDLQLARKVAVVTGSSRGLGLAIASALVAEGCLVTICARGGMGLAEALAKVRALAGADRSRGDAGGGGEIQINRGGANLTQAVEPDAGNREDTREPDGASASHVRVGPKALNNLLAVQADVSTEQGVLDVITRTVETFGGLDILVNNVGLAAGGGIVDTPDAMWREALDHTLYPAIRASRLAVPLMRQRGGGSIVMIASIWGRESGGRMTYNAVKSAEISLAKSMAQQLAKDNIRVNSVAPGSIRVPGGSWDRRLQEDPIGMAEFVKRELPFGRSAGPKKSGPWLRFWPRRVPVGSAGPVLPLTAASHAP
jgi:3-oxoacyl-[acyl-carrier protein] reductase